MPLCVATMKQILAEIERRHQAYVIVMLKAVGEECEHSHGGGFTMALGLLRRSQIYWESSMTPKWTEHTRIKTTDGDEDAPWKDQ